MINVVFCGGVREQLSEQSDFTHVDQRCRVQNMVDLVYVSLFRYGEKRFHTHSRLSIQGLLVGFS